jgi:hypothetical protein
LNIAICLPAGRQACLPAGRYLVTCILIISYVYLMYSYFLSYQKEAHV